jgi:hypothetical protein
MKKMLVDHNKFTTGERGLESKHKAIDIKIN